MTIITFFSHFGAVRFHRTLQEKGIDSTLSPVPRTLSSSCGTCVILQTADIPVEQLLSMNSNKEIEAIYHCLSGGIYEVCWRAPDT